MKKLLPTFFLYVLWCNVNAQDYTGMGSGKVYFYEEPDKNIVFTKIDSSGYASPDSIYHFEKLLRTPGTTVVDTNCSFWGAPHCGELKDAPGVLGKHAIANNGTVSFLNYKNDTIVYSLNTTDSSLVFADSTQQIWLHYVAKDTATLFGSLDSVKQFYLKHLDPSFAVIPSTIHNAMLMFSKNYGMLNGFMLDSFPYVPKEITLIGIRNPHVGFYGLSMALVHDYQVGDVIEYFDSYSTPSFWKVDYFRHTVLSRADFPDKVSYQQEKISQVQTWTGSGWGYVYDTNLVTLEYSKTIFVDEHDKWYMHPYGKGYYAYDTVNFGCLGERIKYQINGTDCYGPCIDNPTCYGSIDCGFGGGSSSLEYLYKQGIGLITNYHFYIGPAFSTIGISYANIGGVACGDENVSVPEMAHVSKVSVYPNPTNGLATIASPGNLIQHLTLLDARGQILQSSDVKNYESSLDTETLSNGVYLLLITTAGGTVNHPLVVCRQ